MGDEGKRPEPIRLRALAVAATAAAIHALVVKGWVPALGDGTQQAVAAGVVDLVGAYVTWRWSRPHVTPTADPRTSESRRLVPAGPDGQPAPPVELSVQAKRALRAELVTELLEQLASGKRQRE